MSQVLALSLALIASAKPVAKPYRGPLDGVDVRAQSASVLAKFDGVDRAQAQEIIDASARALNASRMMRVSFIKTSAGALAAFTLTPGDRPLPFGRFTALARDLSSRTGVAETWAVVAPGPRDDSLEGEAVFAFVRGAPDDSTRKQYRDDPEYLAMLRRRTPESKWKLARWPTYPLSALAVQLGLPGRSCLDVPWQLQTLALEPWPDDAGDNLAPTWVDLPGGMATEILQQGLHEKKSASAVVAAALADARKAGALGEAPGDTPAARYDEGQPDAEKHARRTMTLYLPAEELAPAEDAGAGQAASLSRVVQHAWRRAHPFVRSSK